MRLPKSVLVDDVEYEIREYHGEDYGECCSEEKYIAVNLKKDQIRGTLLHEILHAVFAEYKIKISKEEYVVSLLERGLMQVFDDNPKVARFILNAKRD